MTKQCRRCLEVKEIIEFAKDKSKKDGYQRLCKICDSKKARKWYSENIIKSKVTKKNYARLNIKKNRHRRVERIYNLSDFEYDSMIINQENCCAICKKKSHQSLSVDHDHKCCVGRTSCGKCVRGLLCNRCNMGLGAFYDDIDSLLKAIDYLLDWQKKR